MTPGAPPVECLRPGGGLLGLLKRELACPSTATTLAVYAIGLGLCALVVWRLHTGLTPDMRRDLVANGWAAACAGVGAWTTTQLIATPVGGLSGGVAGLIVWYVSRGVVVSEVEEAFA